MRYKCGDGFLMEYHINRDNKDLEKENQLVGSQGTSFLKQFIQISAVNRWRLHLYLLQTVFFSLPLEECLVLGLLLV